MAIFLHDFVSVKGSWACRPEVASLAIPPALLIPLSVTCVPQPSFGGDRGFGPLANLFTGFRSALLRPQRQWAQVAHLGIR